MEIIFSIIVGAMLAGAPVKTILSICHTETQFRNVYSPHDGHSPSYGACQVKYSTAKSLVPDITREDLMIPWKNAFVSALYYKKNHEKYNSHTKGISAYNAGHATHSNVKYVKKVVAFEEYLTANF